jgi:hypothetical protein
MNEAQALQAIKSAGQLFITQHARDRMAQRRIGYKDVQHALRVASRATRSDDDGDEKWVVASEDIDGDELHVVVIIEEILVAGVRNVVVTVY